MKRIFSLLFILYIHFLALLAVDKPVLLVIGTRPEAIKMIPLYQAFKNAHMPVVLCSTGQHTQLLDDVLSLFKVQPDITLHIMKPGQDLFYLTTAVLEKMKEVLLQVDPRVVIVQGDTTTAMASALAAFYLRIPIAHVEAGLRSGNIYGPFPEEFNRKCITNVATYHFAPTYSAQQQLIAEQVDGATIFYTGNTVVDALYRVLHDINSGCIQPSASLMALLDEKKKTGKKVILLTAHRRESFDGGLDHIFSALNTVLEHNPNLFIVYPVHPNPAIKQALNRTCLHQHDTIALMAPLVYHDLVYLLNICDGVATDSGGITEEAVSLNKRVLMLRNETDRPEGIVSGKVKLVGTDEQAIIDGMQWLLEQPSMRIAHTVSPYGDGHACEHIVNIIQQALYKGECIC